MISKVLNAANWIAYAADHDPRADDIRALIYEAFCSDAAQAPGPVEKTVTESGRAILERSQGN